MVKKLSVNKVKTLLIVLVILVIQTGHVLSQITCGAQFGAWHPTDDEFAINCNNVISIYNAEFQLVKTLTSPEEPDLTVPRVTALSWSPNGMYLASAITRADAPGGDGRASRLVVWNVSTDTIILDIPQRKYPLAWSPDSSLIAANSLSPDALYFYNVVTSEEVSKCLECTGTNFMAWNPTDIHQFMAGQSERILFLDPLASSNPPVEILEDVSLAGNAYNPMGTQIVLYNRQTSQYEIITAYTKQTVATLPSTVIGGIKDYQWLQDGIYITNAEHNILTWDGSSQPEVLLSTVDTKAYWKPDGTKYLAPNVSGDFVRDTATGNLISQLLIGVTSQVSSLTLIDESNSQPIPEYAPIREAAAIGLHSLGTTNLGIRANVNPAAVGSVVFDLNGNSHFQIDDAVPYELTNWSPEPGNYTLTATPYSDAGGTGTAGVSLTITFTIVEGTETTATPSPTNTVTPTGGTFPTTGVLDNFNRADGTVGSNWAGSTGGYSINSNQLQVVSDGDMYWNTAFGANQEASVTLNTINPNASEIDLLLKAQSASWSGGTIEVIYNPSTHVVQVWTYTSSQDWVQRGADIPVTFVPGDVFGARATDSGSVEVYQNSTLLGSSDITAWPYYANGGYIGFWTIGAGNTIFDDFRGGTTSNGNPVPTATATLTQTAGPSPTPVPTATHTPITTPASGPFPTNGVLDNFNRADGSMGSNWIGSTGGYSVGSNQLQTYYGDPIYWNAATFGANQEVYVTLNSINTSADEIDLLLKRQGTYWGDGVLEIWYRPTLGVIQLVTYEGSQGWVQQGADITITFAVGDRFGARAKADGTVEVYRNDTLIGTRDITAWPYYANGGYIGLWTINASGTVLDDFGGGNS